MTRFVAALMLVSALACADDAPEASELVISVVTDFAVGDLSHLVVETLDVQGEQAVDFRWLSVGDACPDREDGLRTLGSFSVQRGDQALARLRILALTQGTDGKAIEVGRERIDAEFARGRKVVEVTVSKVCTAVLCAADETCDATTGACRAVQRLLEPVEAPVMALPRRGCITALIEPPPAVVTRLAPATALCVSGDGRCDAPCEGVRDADCLRARGEACATSVDCMDGAACAHGVCCDRACTGGCERCDLPNQAGTCAPLRYLEARAPLASPDFSAVCTDHHLDYTCAAGRCQARCSLGYADCNGALQEDGCETALGTPQHCMQCGEACTYGYCGDSGCAFHHTTGLETSDSRALNPSRVYASGYLPSSDDGMLRALGVLLHPGQVSGTVRLALYEGNAAGFPDKLLTQTRALSRDDASGSEVKRPAGAVLLEGKVEPVAIDPGKPYFVAVQVAQETRLYGGKDTLMPWFVAPLRYDVFPGYFPLAETTEHEFIALTMYAVTTPH
ncbi:MAG: hypothetical protein ABW252_04185 [Polyangiales bacterium]